jgi:uncharacterized membrane protein
VERLRFANIGIVIGAVIAVLGVVIFRGSGEAALQLVGFASFATSLAVYMALDEWARRRNKRSQ